MHLVNRPYWRNKTLYNTICLYLYPYCAHTHTHTYTRRKYYDIENQRCISFFGFQCPGKCSLNLEAVIWHLFACSCKRCGIKVISFQQTWGTWYQTRYVIVINLCTESTRWGFPLPSEAHIILIIDECFYILGRRWTITK